MERKADDSFVAQARRIMETYGKVRSDADLEAMIAEELRRAHARGREEVRAAIRDILDVPSTRDIED